MTGYVFTLIVPNLNLADDTQLDRLLGMSFEAYPALINGVPEIQVHSSEVNPLRAVGLAVDDLKSIGLRVSSVATDYVSVSDIAERADVNRETARLWATAARRSGFPLATGTVGTSPIWDWADVFDWLIVNQIDVDDMFVDPLPKDSREVMNGRLALGRLKYATGWQASSKPVVRTATVETSGARQTVGLRPYLGSRRVLIPRERTA